MKQKIYSKKRRATFVIGVLLIIALFFILRDYTNDEFFLSIIESTDNKVYIAIIFLIIFIIGIVVGLPNTMFLIISASLFGLVEGIILSLIGFNIGAQVTFFISRSKGKNFIGKFIDIEKYLDKLQYKIEENGLYYVIYLRIIPMLPVNILNYSIGLTSITWKEYTMGTFLGRLPIIITYTYIAKRIIKFEGLNIEDIIFFLLLMAMIISIIIYGKRKRHLD